MHSKTHSILLLNTLLAFLALISTVESQDFYFNRALTCSKNNGVKCTQWNQQSNLFYYASWTSYCFSADTYVLTKDGPKSMAELIIGDQIYSINRQTGVKEFSKVTTWLHRDLFAIAQFQQIETNNGFTFESTYFHNIGFVNKESKIDFKFARDLKAGDSLIGFPNAQITVKDITSHKQKKGLFSPFTETGNFFIYHSDFILNENENQAQMILVHVLSQIVDPNSQLSKAKKFITTLNFLKGSQADYSDQYINPLYSSFKWMFGSNWVQESQLIKYSTYFSPIEGQHSSHQSYSSSSDYRRRRRNLIKSMGLAVSITQQTILL